MKKPLHTFTVQGKQVEYYQVTDKTIIEAFSTVCKSPVLYTGPNDNGGVDLLLVSLGSSEYETILSRLSSEAAEPVVIGSNKREVVPIEGGFKVGCETFTWEDVDKILKLKG